MSGLFYQNFVRVSREIFKSDFHINMKKFLVSVLQPDKSGCRTLKLTLFNVPDFYIFPIVPSQVSTVSCFISSSSNQWVVMHFDSV